MSKARRCNRTARKCWDSSAPETVSRIASTAYALCPAVVRSRMERYLVSEPDARPIVASWAFMSPVTEARA
jgi:hypothetical protein